MHLVEISVREQGYQAVMAVVHDDRKIIEVARRLEVSRQSMHKEPGKRARQILHQLVKQGPACRESAGCAAYMTGRTLTVLSVSRDRGPRGRARTAVDAVLRCAKISRLTPSGLIETPGRVFGIDFHPADRISCGCQLDPPPHAQEAGALRCVPQ